jgi:hypothetical protein
MLFLKFSGLAAGEIEHHPEVEAFPVTRDNRTAVTRKPLNWLIAGANSALEPCR